MSAPVAVKHESPGFFSSASRLSLPVGARIDPAAVAGYPIEMSAKATSSSRRAEHDPVLASLYVDVCQFGLGCYERWLAGDGDEWLQAALDTGRYLLERQQDDGSWIQPRPFSHTFPLAAGWRCGMAQGQAASLLVRLFVQTGDDTFAAAARAALALLGRPVAEGGVAVEAAGGPWPEEYPTSPPSLVLNGAIFAWWGVRDVAVGLGDAEAGEAFATGVETLVRMLPRFDTGSWTLYCLYPFPVPNVASSFYHALHVAQLEAMYVLAPRAELKAGAERWAGYLASDAHRRRALGRKILFRLVVPRNRLLARRMPWLRWPDASAD